MSTTGRRELLVSKGWVQATLLVVLFGFFVLGFLALRTYQEKPPIPERVVDPQGALIYSAEDVSHDRDVFPSGHGQRAGRHAGDARNDDGLA